MNGFSTWLTSICAIVVIGVIVDIFLSDSRTGKFVKCVLASITLLVIVTPLSSLFSSGKLSFDYSEYSISIDEGYAQYITEQKTSVIEKSLSLQLEEEGIKGAEVNITLSLNNEEEIIDFVEINLSKSVIDEKFGHINRNDLVVDLVQKYLVIERDRVKVYE